MTEEKITNAIVYIFICCMTAMFLSVLLYASTSRGRTGSAQFSSGQGTNNGGVLLFHQKEKVE